MVETSPSMCELLGSVSSTRKRPGGHGRQEGRERESAARLLEEEEIALETDVLATLRGCES